MLDLHRMGGYWLTDFVMVVYNQVMFHDMGHLQHSNTTGPNFKILFSGVRQKVWTKGKRLCFWCTVGIKYYTANELKYSVLWWLITSCYAVLKLLPGLQSTDSEYTQFSFKTSYLMLIIFLVKFGIFCIIGEKNGIQWHWNVRKKFFFPSMYLFV